MLDINININLAIHFINLSDKIMVFNNFIFIIGFVWCGYYLIVILFDFLKLRNRAEEITTHHVQFQSETPVLINDEFVSRNNLTLNGEVIHSKKEYLPNDNVNELKSPDKEKSVMVDLGLETISGAAYEVSAENLSKYMKV